MKESKRCQICSAEMNCISVDKASGRRRYNVAILECPICLVRESSTAGDDMYEQIALEDQKELFKQQEENQYE